MIQRQQEVYTLFAYINFIYIYFFLSGFSFMNIQDWQDMEGEGSFFKSSHTGT